MWEANYGKQVVEIKHKGLSSVTCLIYAVNEVADGYGRGYRVVVEGWVTNGVVFRSARFSEVGACLLWGWLALEDEARQDLEG